MANGLNLSSYLTLVATPWHSLKTFYGSVLRRARRPELSAGSLTPGLMLFNTLQAADYAQCCRIWTLHKSHTLPLKNLECSFAGKICMQITMETVMKNRDTLLRSSSAQQSLLTKQERLHRKGYLS